MYGHIQSKDKPEYKYPDTVHVVNSRIEYYHERLGLTRTVRDGSFSPTCDMSTMMQYQLHFYQYTTSIVIPTDSRDAFRLHVLQSKLLLRLKGLTPLKNCKRAENFVTLLRAVFLVGIRQCSVWEDVLTKIILLEEFLQEIHKEGGQDPVVILKRQRHLDSYEDFSDRVDPHALIEAA